MTTTAYDLRGRRALVTGAAHAVGRATVLALAEAGAAVVASYTGDTSTVDSLARRLDATDGDHRLVRADVSCPGGVATVVDACRAHLGSVDIVVTAPPATDRVPLEVLVTTLTAPLLVTRGLRPLLETGASIVHLGTSTASGLIRPLAKELGPDGVRVNLVAVDPAAAKRPEQVAAVALFLASDESGGVNGETLVVNGGE